MYRLQSTERWCKMNDFLTVGPFAIDQGFLQFIYHRSVAAHPGVIYPFKLYNLVQGRFLPHRQRYYRFLQISILNCHLDLHWFARRLERDSSLLVTRCVAQREIFYSTCRLIRRIEYTKICYVVLCSNV